MALTAAYAMLPDRRLSALLHHPAPTYLAHAHAPLAANAATSSTSKASSPGHPPSRGSPMAFPASSSTSFASQWNSSIGLERVPDTSYGHSSMATNPTPASLSSYLNSSASLSTHSWSSHSSQGPYSEPGPGDGPSASLHAVTHGTLSNSPGANSNSAAPSFADGGGSPSFGDYAHDRFSLPAATSSTPTASPQPPARAAHYSRVLGPGEAHSPLHLHSSSQQHASLASMAFGLPESSQRTILGHGAAGGAGASSFSSAAFAPSHSPSPPAASGSNSPYAFPPPSPPYRARSSGRTHAQNHHYAQGAALYALPPSPLPVLPPLPPARSPPLVKKEPQDGFIIEAFSHAAPAQPAASSSSSSSAQHAEPMFLDPPVSIYALNNTASSVPLRATQASKEMRRMMGVFRLDPFAVTSGGVQFAGDGGDPEGGGWRYEDEAGPLADEPVLLEWQVDGWVCEVDPQDEEQDLIPFEDMDEDVVEESYRSTHSSQNHGHSQRWNASSREELTLADDILYPSGKGLPNTYTYATTSPHTPLALPAASPVTIPTPVSLAQLSHSPSIANLDHPSLSSYTPGPSLSGFLNPARGRGWEEGGGGGGYYTGSGGGGGNGGGGGYEAMGRRGWLGAQKAYMYDDSTKNKNIDNEARQS
ncbi:hypothetical protein GLOTRDRAFT_95742 [Gloeophyllum trabeum ATCC 11539]|uniref:Uncharacterized protein n=1 Tax=Gloeophyllum trabeum (strain ATCC 11539 / FP-39264 / Madison 617) TaxID=670483 RepID=S7PX48_GLOTA|nr:uncharacterized protein GLOTRDRAFT_95742 [Gloeophyllum trabeum ATCC 11539]EPQ52063.1 hypothetical protein GLOTRDRAFT_95742 [Gloeophyllum trabeum ATCC 11539]